MRLSVLIIARNEEVCLPNALASVTGADEIIVVDTGSTDDTPEIARKAGAKVFEFPWRDDFGAARNFAIEKATGDWCLTLDADWKLVTLISYVRDQVDHLSREGIAVASIEAVHPDGLKHRGAWLHRNTPSIRWVGAVHEVLNIPAQADADVVVDIGSSPNKAKDPARNIRILSKSDLTEPRNQFYLAREYFERADYVNAIRWMEIYLQKATWLPEICEARLVLARCYWQTNRGDDARRECMEAIRQNPDFREALSFMGELYFEPWRHRWKRLAEAATNEDVLFVRAV